ncbi:DUF6461 domain-containing protein [Kitasatospora purpeofusca]|uniref:DUF6461 domain-containing protein n=1 Tax=Kitasatospora purpeofusca TaxID=67352 RepID=UPI00382DD956
MLPDHRPTAGVTGVTGVTEAGSEADSASGPDPAPVGKLSVAWTRICAMTVTAADHLWFEDGFPDLAEAYCFTLVKDLAPAELPQRLNGAAGPSLTGVTAVVDAADDLGDTQQLITMAGVGPWTLMIEPSGCLGVSEERALPASAGTTWISRFCNTDGSDSFLWAEDATVRRTSRK